MGLAVVGSGVTTSLAVGNGDGSKVGRKVSQGAFEAGGNNLHLSSTNPNVCPATQTGVVPILMVPPHNCHDAASLVEEKDMNLVCNCHFVQSH